MALRFARFRILGSPHFRLWLAVVGIVLVGGGRSTTAAPDQDPPAAQKPLIAPGPDQPKWTEDQRSRSIEPSLLKTFSVSGRVGSFVLDSKAEMLVIVGWNIPDSVADSRDQWSKGKSRGDIRIWNVARGAEIDHFGDEAGGMFDVAISPNNGAIITAGRFPNSRRQGEVGIWDAKTRKRIRSLGNQTNWVLCVACSPDGKMVATGGFDPTIRIWEAATGKEMKTLKPWKAVTRSICFSRDGKTLVAGNGAGKLTLWRVDTWDTLHSFEAIGLSFSSAALTPDGKYLAVVGFELPTRPLRVATPERSKDNATRVLKRPPKWGGGMQGKVVVWDVSSSLEVRAYPVVKGYLSGVALSPDGRYCAVTGSVTKIWRVDTGAEVADFHRRGGSSDDRIHFFPDGKMLAISDLHSVTLWDVSGLSAPGRIKK